MKAKRIWWMVAGVCLGVTAGISLFHSPEHEVVVPEEPDWIEPLREGNLVRLGEVEPETIDAWLKTRLQPGETTREEVFALLGDPREREFKLPRYGADLDRPDRDRIDSYQYLLWYGDNVNWTAMGFDFDHESGKLLDFGISGCICGYCPHVLAHDGRRWRLEGKMLAGRIGEDRMGSDLLVLPRLRVEDGLARVQLANWAPEIETLREPKLLTVSREPGEELDVDSQGEPVVWKSIREVEIDGLDSALGDKLSGGDLLVLEVKNTARLESYLRSVFLDGEPDQRNTSLVVDFGDAESVEVAVVGTKFLRRIAVPIPHGATGVRFRGNHEFWYSRRVWIGTRTNFADRAHWTAPIDSVAEEFQLEPMETIELQFPVDETGNPGFALQLRGFYEFRAD